MSRRRNELAPTLFPFLAVLVCTLGTLILFLALVAQNATEAAQQDVAESVPAGDEDDRPVATGMTAEQAERLVAEGKFRVEQLVSYRVEQTAEIEEQRDRLTHLDEHLDRLRQKLRRLREEVEAATSTSQEPAASRDEILLLKRQIESETEELRRLEAERENREPRIVIVPPRRAERDRSPSGLSRMYGDDALTIWPEGTRISFDQLLASTPAANPLDDALRIIRHHAMQRYGDASPPYPLLVVRPDGIDTYAAARRAMTDWDDQFGYELVPAATELAFPEPDLALRDRIERAVAEAVRGQQALHRRERRRRTTRIRNRTSISRRSRRSRRGGGVTSGDQSAANFVVAIGMTRVPAESETVGTETDRGRRISRCNNGRAAPSRASPRPSSTNSPERKAIGPPAASTPLRSPTRSADRDAVTAPLRRCPSL